MKLLWIGAGVGPLTKKRILENNGKLLSAYLSQTNLVQGMDVLDLDMDTLNGMNVEKSVLRAIDREEWSRNGKNQDISVGYRNTKYVNRLYKQKALCKEAETWARALGRERDAVIFVYGMHTPFMAAACAVKQMIPNAKICLIVPDLPQYMDLKMSTLKKLLKRLDWQRIRRYMKSVDKYVLYAEPMAQFLGLTDGQWIVMEGSYDSTQLADKTVVSVKEKNAVMYSGVLDMRYGIPELLDAMKLLDDSYELWLTGDGNAVELIRERATEDKRIQFFGYLPSRQALINKQAEATMLINPRRDTEAGSKYCFPSKLFEYMVSGRPVLSCPLAGIPEEYYDKLVLMDSTKPEDIAAAIQKVADMTPQQRQTLGEKGRNFVLTQKNNVTQAQRIARFALEKEI